jgi:hypothetical protein
MTSLWRSQLDVGTGGSGGIDASTEAGRGTGGWGRTATGGSGGVEASTTEAGRDGGVTSVDVATRLEKRPGDHEPHASGSVDTRLNRPRHRGR